MSGKTLFNAVFSPISFIVGDKIGHAITGAFLVAVGMATGAMPLVGLGMGIASTSLQKKPQAPKASSDRLRLTLDPSATRKVVFGQTAMAADVRYQAATGTNQEYWNQIVAVASHQVSSIDEIWFENEKAWTKTGGAQGRFAGYLDVTDRLVGTSSNGIAIDSAWTANCRLTGCAYLHLRYKLTGNSKKTDSPFAQAIPSRVTIRGKGALVYDPRLDSTVAGGSGAQRANDQTTWAFSPSGSNGGRNPALQLLWYRLGWRIQDPAAGTWKLAVGRGMPPARINLASFITAANICDESVTLAAGGTEPRYRSDFVISESDDPAMVERNLLAAMNGWLDDSGGQLTLNIYKNDLATPALSMSEADVLGDELWDPTPLELHESFNVVRGRYTDPSDNALYQPAEYPEVRLASVDGIERIEPIDFVNVQSSPQVQRLAKTWLQRQQYQGRYSARFNARAWKLSRGKIVTFSHQGLGWSNKLFRVVAIGVGITGQTQLVLQEENAAIYAWSAEESAAVTAAAPIVYDPQNSPILLGIAESRNVIYRQVSDPTGSNTVRDGDMWIELVSPMRVWVRVGGSWQTAANYITQGLDIGVANGATKNTIYRQSTAPSSPIDGDWWVDTSTTPNVTKVRVSGAWQSAANLVTQGIDIGVANGATATANEAQTANPDFQVYTNATGLADNWNNLSNHSGSNTTRVAGFNRAYAMQVVLGASPTTTTMYQAVGTSAQQTVVAGQYLVIEADLRIVSGAATGAHILVDFVSSGNLSVGGLHLDLGTEKTTADALVSATGEYSWRKVIKAPAGSFYYNLYVYTANASYGDISAARTYIWRHVAVRAASDTEVKTYGQEAGADLTRILTPESAQVIQYDYTGTSSSQVPKILTNKMMAGGSNVTPSTSFSYSASGCTIDTAGCITGQVRLTAVTAANATIDITATYAGISRTDSIPIQRILGSNPSGGSGGSGAAGFDVDVSASITDTSYDGTPQPLHVAKQMRSNGSGQIHIILNGEYSGGPNQTAQIFAKAQKSTDNATWSDAGLSATGTTATGGSWIDTNGNGVVDAGEEVTEVVGTIGANSLVSGFTASTDYWIRWIAYKSGTTTTVGVSGTASGAQS